MVKRECDAFNLLVSSINKARDCEMIGLVDGLRSMYGVHHWSSDYVRIYNGQVKCWLAFSHEFPCSCLRASFGNVIAENRIIPRDSLFSSHLNSC